MDNFYKLLIAWFKKNRRDLPWRKNITPYSVWISEIMLQQTQAKTVIPYFESWLKEFPNIEKLNQADLSEVLKVWQGLGYYSRAKNVKRAAKIIDEEFNGAIPSDYQELIKLPGIGDYTAKAILNFAFKKNFLAIDANVYRVFSRLFLISFNPSSNQARKVIDKYFLMLTKNKAKVYQFNEALFELGNFICQKKPLCPTCPVANYCQANLEKKTHLFPKTKTKSIIQVVSISFLISRAGKYLLFLRSKEARLNSFWELPTLEHIEFNLNETEKIKKEFAKKYQFAITDLSLLSHFTHHYTKYKILNYTFKAIEAKIETAPLLIADKNFFHLSEVRKLPVTKPTEEIVKILENKKI